MKLIQRKEIYWVDFRALDGKRRRLSTGESDKTKAQLRAADIVRSFTAASDSPGVAHTHNLTLGQHMEKHYATHWASMKSRIVMRHVVNRLCAEIGYWPVQEVTYGKLKDYGDALIVSGKKPATVNRRMSAISSTLTEAKRREELSVTPEIPFWKENNKRERYMSIDEEARVLAWLAKYGTLDDELLYVRQLAIFLIDTGFRFSEAFKFYVDNGHACLAPLTKADKPRRVPLTERAAVAARAILAYPWHIDPAITIEQRWTWVEHRWTSATKAEGCRDVTLHILRHTCGSRLVQRGINIYVVSKWLGHASVRTTERYAHLAPDTMSQALAALEGKPVGVAETASVTSLHGTRSLHM
jgi:integrase